MSARLTVDLHWSTPSGGVRNEETWYTHRDGTSMMGTSRRRKMRQWGRNGSSSTRTGRTRSARRTAGRARSATRAMVSTAVEPTRRAAGGSGRSDRWRRPWLKHGVLPLNTQIGRFGRSPPAASVASLRSKVAGAQPVIAPSAAGFATPSRPTGQVVLRGPRWSVIGSSESQVGPTWRVALWRDRAECGGPQTAESPDVRPVG
jgi:hypothetical protein